MTDLDAFLLLCLACGSVFCAGFLGRLAGRAEGWRYGWNKGREEGWRIGRRQGLREAEEEHRERIMYNHGDN